ncbi:MAG: ribosome silencing factor [Burkholderiaceae bacterium]|uniref:Ribosomal silencing factor RsfS n=1 Tax=Herminiimonas contaminans TaxID=1111140 RepID=A0ABS0EZ45_9BURK|nr:MULTISPECIES: ribosome silencing factor [Oxalobacteraceae]MBF8179503.1 ribosome silencing factor [Herminiimonas contaminans]MBX9800184.1 ribosome silencing factor [Burkholderiaceae bacterium]
MDIKKLQALVVDALEDVKAQDIKVFDTVHLTSLFDRIAVASGTSNRQTKALAASVRDKVKSNGGEIVSIEGEDTGEWVLVDLGDMIVHIMQPAIRAYYRLEEIWGEKEVKFGAAKRTSKRITAESDETPKKAVGRHLAASQTTLDDDEPKKPARKTAAAKTPAKKAPAKKAVGKTIKVAATKTAEAYKKAAPKKAPAKKVASKAAAKTRAPAKPKAKTAE